MGIDDCDNIGMPIEKVYKVNKKEGKITAIDCKTYSEKECDEIFREDLEKGTEEYKKAEKEIEQVEEAAEELEGDKTKTL
jgi:hypothetical protein